MNGSVMFDTLAFAKKLKSVGFSDAQAEVQAETIVTLLEERLATKVDTEMVKRDIENSRAELKRDIENIRAELKRDIENIRTELKHDIENIRAELKHDIEIVKRDIEIVKRDIENTKVELKRDLKELELRMIIKMGAMILAAVGLLVTAQRLWPIQVQYIPPGIHQETQATPLQTPVLPAVPAQH
ncbi:MAG: DUF1640 domain-containing protein [Magnetococcales bacterium]|nr:DUF1640 domain-containing protein [Magnetococcales bacterium]